MPFRCRPIALSRRLTYLLLAFALSASGCSSGEGSSNDTQPSSVSGNAGTTGNEDSDTTGQSDSASDDTASDDGASDDGASNPAAAEIRELISAQSTIYGWDSNQVNCITDAMIATGAASPTEIRGDAYADIILGCDAVRGQLEFAMSLTHDSPTARCLIEKLSDAEIDDLGSIMLRDSLEVAETAFNDALAEHPDCG